MDLLKKALIDKFCNLEAVCVVANRLFVLRKGVLVVLEHFRSGNLEEPEGDASHISESEIVTEWELPNLRDNQSEDIEVSNDEDWIWTLAISVRIDLNKRAILWEVYKRHRV